MQIKILIIDDDPASSAYFKKILEKSGYEVTAINDGRGGLGLMAHNEYDIIVTDLMMPDVSGMDIIKESNRRDPNVPVIVVTAYGTISNAVDAIKEGACEFLLKPLSADVLLKAIKKWADQIRLFVENEKLKVLNRELFQKIAAKSGFGELIGGSRSMISVYETLENLSAVDVNVLITGETGTGKDLVARTIHQKSERRDGPFVAVNCGAMSETLLGSELFGHEKGAFTGAVSMRKGKFEMADGGTLFLDEVGNMSMSLQQSLLRILEEKRVERLGGHEGISVDVRIISATNADLEKEIVNGNFRQDLYYRFNVITIELPPLRERMDDIPLLVQHFIKKHRERYHKDVSTISQKVLNRLMEYDWPGNVRQLEHIMERAIVMCKGRSITEITLPDFEKKNKTTIDSGMPNNLPLKQFLSRTEKSYIENILGKYKGNIGKTADVCGITPKSLFLKMQKYGIKKENFKTVS